jgi:hypothetical protein
LKRGAADQTRRSNAVLLLLIAIQLVLPVRLVAQDAATVPSSSDVYDRLEFLAARLGTSRVFLGDRPMSRRQIKVALSGMRAKLESGNAGLNDRTARWARTEIEVLERSLDAPAAKATSGLRLDWSASGGLFSSDAPSARVRANNLGSIDASAHPFTRARFGRPTGQGTVLVASATGVVGLGERFAAVVEPRVTVGNFRDGSRDEDIFPQRAFVRGVLRNVAISVGADEMRWGHSPFGALFISGNASAPPAIQLSTDTAVKLPWLSRITGPMRFSALVADLGPSQTPPRAKLAGWQVNMKPVTRAELAVSLLAQTGGGDSIPSASLLERIADLIPVLGAAFPRLDNRISNKLAGGHLLVHVPELSDLAVYYELQFDDFDLRRIKSTFVDDASHLLGARMPVSLESGEAAIRVEWHHTAMRLYQHGDYKSGVTYRQRIIGSPLASHAAGMYAAATWRNAAGTTLEVAVADEIRDPSLFANPPSARDTAFAYVRLTDDPRIRGRRALFSVERAVGSGALRATVGYNRAWLSGGAPPSGPATDPPRSEWMASVAMRSALIRSF